MPKAGDFVRAVLKYEHPGGPVPVVNCRCVMAPCTLEFLDYHDVERQGFVLKHVPSGTEAFIEDSFIVKMGTKHNHERMLRCMRAEIKTKLSFADVMSAEPTVRRTKQ